MTDKRFKVTFLEGSKQDNPDLACWLAMHQCYHDGSDKASKLKPKDPVEATIRNAIKFGHYDVLRHASVGLQFSGFPHSVAMQMRTHRQMAVLCQSMRYTGERFIQCANGEVPVDELFYLRDSTASSWAHCLNSCQAYRDSVDRGQDKESARDLLASGYRQGFTISGNFKEWMHLFDRRLLKDTQMETRVAAELALGLLCDYSDFFKWYRDKRAGKNNLAP